MKSALEVEARHRSAARAVVEHAIGAKGASAAGGTGSATNLDPTLLSKGQRVRVARHSVQQSSNDVVSDPAWTRGLGLGNHNSALKPEFIDMCASHMDIESEFVRMFPGEPVTSDEASDAAQYRPVCHIQYGICCSDPLFDFIRRPALLPCQCHRHF